MKKRFNFFTVFIGISLLIVIIFMLYFISNIKPSKKQFNFANSIKDRSFIKNYQIERKNGRIAIYFETNSEIFKEYNYHSYISGDATGRKIDLQTFLVSEDNNICYKIKSYCYDYSNTEDLKFIGYYYENFIDTNKKYKVAIYTTETDMLYITDIEI